MWRGGGAGGALVLGADYRALGVVRSLGRRGVPVHVMCETAEPLASLSRYADARVEWPVVADSARIGFLRQLALSQGLRGWVLIPTADETAALVARHHDELDELFTHTTPRWDTLRWAYDKRLTYELADQVGVPRPVTTRPRTPAEAAELDISFPAVLKPAIKQAPNALTVAKAWRIADRHEAAMRFAQATEFLSPDVLMIQEHIPGGGETQFSYAALCRGGIPLASLTARRTRQYPADFGRASTFVETVDCPELIAPSERLLAELGWDGLIEIEYKRDVRDGQLKLLDMNARVWGWHTLCGRAGVDFPWLLWQLAAGEHVSAVCARPGVRWLRMTTDTPTALGEVFARRLPLRDYARSFRPPREPAIFAWDDPLPGLAEVPVLAYVAARRLLQGRRI